ncbi:MAG: 4'-phosphopantetheinyl transferase superfamily protein [Solobacterium sp.]|nr:4'-phosphopantetheinyl transferase superfamily protein [Solobacterium sp.]
MTGIDIVDLKRVPLQDSFLKRILTEKEMKEYMRLSGTQRRREYAGGRFACKEAIFKATQDPDYLHYSILHGENGRPYVEDHPEIEISISHDGGIAAAVVLIRTE